VIKNIIYFGISILIFFTGVILYGIILNMREITLTEAMKVHGLTKLNNVYLIVDKNNFKLDLYSDSLMIKSYKAVYGRNTSRIKKTLDDNVTPIGIYKICMIDSSDLYHKFLQLNYPDLNDVAELYKNGYIGKIEYNDLTETLSQNDCLPEEFNRDKKIGIHGIGEYNLIFKNLPFVFNWTNGSIAVSNENIDELFKVTQIGTTVEIIY
jgi:murein L,D-transpeptidase YafK